MPIDVTAHLTLDDERDPPEARVKLVLDGVQVADRQIQATAEWLSVLQAIANAAQYDLAAQLAPAVDAIIADLDRQQAEEEDKRARRLAARSDWQAAKQALEQQATPG